MRLLLLVQKQHKPSLPLRLPLMPLCQQTRRIDLDVSGFDVFPSDYLLSVISDYHSYWMEKRKPVPLSTIADDGFEGNETATIPLTNLSAGLTLGNDYIVNISIIDNEFCPSFTTEPDEM